MGFSYRSRDRRADGAGACVANFDKATGRYTLHAGGGGAVRQKREIADVLASIPNAARDDADVGGNFGTRNRVYVE